MTNNTALHTRLLSLANEPSGFAVSEVSGYSPTQVRAAAEALVKDGRLQRARVTPRRVRYFASVALAQRYRAAPPARAARAPAGGNRFKAQWSPDQEAIITPRTKIVIAPPPPRDVFRTSTYQQF